MSKVTKAVSVDYILFPIDGERKRCYLPLEFANNDTF